jgi:hypothetical protein
VFKQDTHRSSSCLLAPAAESDHLGLLGLLNSSVACFWLKQVCFPKDGQGQMWEERFAFNATNVAEFPVEQAAGRWTVPRRMDSAGATAQHIAAQPASVLATTPPPTRAMPGHGTRPRRYSCCGSEHDSPCRKSWIGTATVCMSLLPAGTGACRRRVGGALQHASRIGTWASEPLRSCWPVALPPASPALQPGSSGTGRNLYHRHSCPLARGPTGTRRGSAALNLIERDPSRCGLLEQPRVYKRRWNSPQWARPGTGRAAATGCWPVWSRGHSGLPALISRRRSTPPAGWLTRCSATPSSCRSLGLYAGHADFDVAQLVAGLVTARVRSLPACPALLRHGPSQARAVGRHLGTAAARRQGRERGQHSRPAQVQEGRLPEGHVLATFAVVWTYPRSAGSATPAANAAPTPACPSPGLAGTICSKPPRWPPTTSR